MTDPIPISVVVTTRNEAAGIVRCLAAVAEFDEVVVVDSESTDATAELARTAGARVVGFAWNGRYPKKKQWILDRVETRHPWILVLDADETPTPALVAELRELAASGGLDGLAAVDIRLDYVFAGRTLRHGHRVVKRALVHRDRVRYPPIDDLDVPGMGEQEGHYQPEAAGRVGRARAHLRHDDPEPVRAWLERHNRYSDWEAALRLRSAERRAVDSHKTSGGRAFARVPLKPLAFFVYSYLVRGGFLDGRPGFDYAVGLSFYYWQIGVKTRELRAHAATASDRSRPPKIVQVIPSIDGETGGPAAIAVGFATALETRGVSSVLLARSRGFGRAPDWGLLRSIWRESRGADLVYLHGQYLPAHVVGYAAARLRAVPYAVQPHGTLEPYDRARSRARKSVYNALVGRTILRRAEFVAFTSESEAEDAADVVATTRALLVPPGVELDEPRPIDEVEARLAGVPRERVALSLGRLAPVKRLDVLIRAWADAGDGRPRRLVIAGPDAGVSRSELERIAAEAGAADEVVLVGAVSGGAKSWLYRRSGLFVLASQTENFAISVAEAMTSGCAVIVSSRVGIAPLVAGSGSGLVLADADRAGLARAITGCLADPDGLRLAGRNAAALAHADFRWDPAVDAVLARLDAAHRW